MLVAVVTPDYAELKKRPPRALGRCRPRGARVEAGGAQPLAQMEAEAKAAKLKPFELPKAVFLESSLNELNQGFSIENDCLTPTFKLKRPQLLKKYQEEIDKLYVSLKSRGPFQVQEDLSHVSAAPRGRGACRCVPVAEPQGVCPQAWVRHGASGGWSAG